MLLQKVRSISTDLPEYLGVWQYRCGHLHRSRHFRFSQTANSAQFNQIRDHYRRRRKPRIELGIFLSHPFQLAAGKL